MYGTRVGENIAVFLWLQPNLYFLNFFWKPSGFLWAQHWKQTSAWNCTGKKNWPQTIATVRAGLKKKKMKCHRGHSTQKVSFPPRACALSHISPPWQAHVSICDVGVASTQVTMKTWERCVRRNTKGGGVNTKIFTIHLYKYLTRIALTMQTRQGASSWVITFFFF